MRCDGCLTLLWLTKPNAVLVRTCGATEQCEPEEQEEGESGRSHGRLAEEDIHDRKGVWCCVHGAADR
jgi:hypothetical protein